MLKRWLLWFGTFGLLLALLGLLGGASRWSLSEAREPSTAAAPVGAAELPTAVEHQADALQNLPALTF